MFALLHFSPIPWLHHHRQHERNDDERPLTARLQRQLMQQIAGLDASSLDGFTFRRRPSQFPDAVAELDIYDAGGRLAIQGREFRDVIAVWIAPAPARMPSWHTVSSPYVPPPHVHYP
jgi:hypothetical protein